MKASFYFPILLIALIFSSCTKDEIRVSNRDRNMRLQEVHEIVSDVEDLIEDLDNVSGDEIDSNTNYCGSYMIEYTPSIKKVTFRFGRNGCQTSDGKKLKGTMILLYQLNTTLNYVKMIDVSFVNFSINNIKVEGFEKRNLLPGAIPELHTTTDVRIIWEDNTDAIYDGEKVSKKVAGANTNNPNDDEYLVTGDLELKLRNNDEFDVLVINPLKRKRTCEIYVSGKLKITSENEEDAFLDYGDGNCDNQAIYTHPDGTIETITVEENIL
jgi:hypothetical protein